MAKLKIKVCGMKDKENIKELIDVLPDFIGFIFYPHSKRFVGNNFDKKIIDSIPSKIKKVGVFVNSGLKEIISIKQKYNLDFVQLHGTETPDYCKELFNNKISIIKAFGVLNDFDFSALARYKPFCKYFLFDTKTKSFGGSGEKFDWKMLNDNKINLPFFLSGGISNKDIAAIKKIKNSKLFGVDINSKFEVEPGIKEIEKIKTFIEKLN